MYLHSNNFSKYETFFLDNVTRISELRCSPCPQLRFPKSAALHGGPARFGKSGPWTTVPSIENPKTTVKAEKNYQFSIVNYQLNPLPA
jgi:hypothetical protein